MSDGWDLSDEGTKVALPHFFSIGIEGGNVALGVSGHHIQLAIAGDVGDRWLPLDIAHLLGPPLLGLALVVQHIQEALHRLQNE